MHPIIVIAALLVLLVLAKPLIRIAMLLFVRTALRGALAGVGEKAMAKQPDTIHLTPSPDHRWADAAAVEALAAPLATAGFEAGESYGIAEMPEVFVRFLVQPQERVAACIYEHPKVGTWLDLFSHYADETGITLTTAKPTGLDERPGARVIHAPGTGSEALYQRLLRERPAGELIPLTLANVVERFEASYARATAWRKNKGVSAEEVARHIQQVNFKVRLSGNDS